MKEPAAPTWSDFIRPEVRAMAPYTPIIPFDRLAAALNRPEEDIVKLDANENPYGPAPGAQAALARLAHVNIYPDPDSQALRTALAAFTGLPAERLLAGAGADELIDLVLRAVLRPDDVVFDCPPSFGMYPFSTAVNGGRLVTVGRGADFGLDVPAIEAAVAAEPRARVLFVCSPNNPDGSVVDDDSLRRLLALPLLVVLDEAYVDFAEPAGSGSRKDWALKHDNLVVLRTFSKLAGLAGLRVGYGIFPEWLLPHIWKIKQPYNVNVAAAAAAMAAMEDTAWLRATTGALIAERERLRAALARLPGLDVYPSQANFLLCRVRHQDAAALKQDLAQDFGILVRYFNRPGLDNCIRISIGRPEQSDRLLAALRQLLPEREVT